MQVKCVLADTQKVRQRSGFLGRGDWCITCSSAVERPYQRRVGGSNPLTMSDFAPRPPVSTIAPGNRLHWAFICKGRQVRIAVQFLEK